MKNALHIENHRYKDVLFALAAASEHQQSLGRLPLQKLVYLSDVLSILWRELANPARFMPYHHGPYDPRIQNAVDALLFRGFAELKGLSFRNLRKTESRYHLAKAGTDAVRQLTKLPGLANDFELFREIAREVDCRGWEVIKQLVYAEPTYDTSRASGEPQRLRTDLPTRNLSLQLMHAMREALSRKGNAKVSRRTLVQMFFGVLDEYRNSVEWGFRSDRA